MGQEGGLVALLASNKMLPRNSHHGLVDSPPVRRRGIGFTADLDGKQADEGPANPSGNPRKSPN